MKIDPSVPFPSDSQSERVTSGAGKATQSSSSGSASGTSGGTSAASGEDTFSLSSAHGEVLSLTASLANVPELRTKQVSALQQSVNSGAYQPDSLKVADAMIDDHAGRAL
ncbi:MAG: flagellar biosynthesis anti-sigma factor FlgM [Candidatus Acidiferrum sp.]